MLGSFQGSSLKSVQVESNIFEGLKFGKSVFLSVVWKDLTLGTSRCFRSEISKRRRRKTRYSETVRIDGFGRIDLTYISMSVFVHMAELIYRLREELRHYLWFMEVPLCVRGPLALGRC